jgi:adenylate cyclase
MSLVQGGVLALAHHFAWKGLCVGAFLLGHWRIEMVAMLLAGGLCYGATFALRWRVLRNLLGIVKGEAIARALEDDPDRLRLKGELREVTVLFADIRDFTSFSESRPAQEVVALLNAYFAAVVPVIEGEGGVLDKYIGDGIMAIFGAPDDQPDHAERAARAAALMAARTSERASRWSALNFEGMKIGVGVQTGPAVVGTVGCPGRMDYTAIGATVNAASRIESATKGLQTPALIGAATRNALSPEARARLGVAEEADTVFLKGISVPVEVYRLGIQGAKSIARAESNAGGVP